MIDLVADKASYRLPAPEATGEGAESFYTLVSGDGEDAALSVDFDGVKQTVVLATGKRTEGKAAPLYRLKPRKDRTASCTTDSKFKSVDHALAAARLQPQHHPDRHHPLRRRQVGRRRQDLARGHAQHDVAPLRPALRRPQVGRDLRRDLDRLDVHPRQGQAGEGDRGQGADLLPGPGAGRVREGLPPHLRRAREVPGHAADGPDLRAWR
ncbi:hypothetical protein G5V59_21215 [Nocardioides sp. W3-2-3]|uniref:hypothetical protein n=1 Tax=Nocardioides convexus TaxID=2712224 RepID=UPI0024181E94|nr:hypothetical protein [Nocardioides convexus]NHA01475.1 hypothetical protein [Nocardioides convexus]